MGDIPAVFSDSEFWWHDLDGGKHGPYQTEREGWRSLVTTVLEMRDAALAKAQTYEDEAMAWHAKLIEIKAKYDLDADDWEAVPNTLEMLPSPKRPHVTVCVRYTAEEADRLLFRQGTDERLTTLVKRSLTEYLIEAAAMGEVKGTPQPVVRPTPSPAGTDPVVHLLALPGVTAVSIGYRLDKTPYWLVYLESADIEPSIPVVLAGWGVSTMTGGAPPATAWTRKP